MSNPTLIPYLFFSGRCEEAIEFYSQTIGAQLQVKMLYNQSPTPIPEGQLQAGFENKVMHATLTIGQAVMMLSDGRDDKMRFDGFQLTLQYATEAEARHAFEGLADGGVVDFPLMPTFYSPCFGMLTDKFHVHWMVMVPGEQK